MEYLDFEVEIGKGQGRKYPVTVIRSPAGEAGETMTFPFDPKDLGILHQILQNPLSNSGGILPQQAETVQDFGQKLFNALMVGEIGKLFKTSQYEAGKQDKGLRLKLRCQDPELASVPWEFLCDSQKNYLCLSKKTPLIRYQALGRFTPKMKVTLPLRILGMSASPKNLSELDVNEERQLIEEAVKKLRDTDVLELEWVKGQGWRDLQKCMQEGPWHIFHFSGHGYFDQYLNKSFLWMNDTDGNSQLSPDQFANFLADHHSLRLVILNSCEGAKGSGQEFFSSTAAILVQKGIAAVLAMQYKIHDRVAKEFSRTFYNSLANRLPIEASVAEARSAVNAAFPNTLEWGTPVLYMRSPDGVLLERKSRLRVETNPPKATITLPNVPGQFYQNMELDPGRYLVEATAEGFKPHKEWVELEAGENKYVSITLTKFARLWVDTVPSDAKVKILNHQINFSSGMELEPGSYEIEGSAPGYMPKRERVELAAGENKYVITLTKFARLWVETTPPDATVAILNHQIDFSSGLQLEPGSYKIEGSAAWHVSKRAWVELGPGENKRIRIQLLSWLFIVVAALLVVGLFMASGWILSAVFSAKEKTQSPPVMESFTNSIGMKFVRIPAGTFQMGSPAGEADRDNDERQHQVTISRPFYLQTTEVTQEQWREVMGSTPARFKYCGRDCPVENVSWDDAHDFISNLNKMEKIDTYRLPTEAEWEWACRAKNTGRFCFGDNEAGLKDYAWYDKNSAEKTHPVGQPLKPNAWGLYNMHGNVWEWCQDWYGEYPAESVSDPQGPGIGKSRVLRSGAWGDFAKYLRSAERYHNIPDFRNGNVGFRVARTMDGIIPPPPPVSGINIDSFDRNRKVISGRVVLLSDKKFRVLIFVGKAGGPYWLQGAMGGSFTVNKRERVGDHWEASWEVPEIHIGPDVVDLRAVAILPGDLQKFRAAGPLTPDRKSIEINNLDDLPEPKMISSRFNLD